jgi:nucleoid-associated protein YgaU|eukprot:COSAG02_NODE_566_length_20219_cov_13.531759_24_plen_115_part_00
MACFTVAELSFCREKLGLEVVGEEDLGQMVAAFMSAAKAVHAARAASDAAKKEAEIQAELESTEDEESKAKLAAQATLLASSREQAEATAAAKQAEREAAPVPAMVDWPMFVTV